MLLFGGDIEGLVQFLKPMCQCVLRMLDDVAIQQQWVVLPPLDSSIAILHLYCTEPTKFQKYLFCAHMVLFWANNKLT